MSARRRRARILLDDVGVGEALRASSLSLRIPSLLFAIVTPLLIFWKGHPHRLTRQMWAALAALWVPSFFHASDARAYTLLFLLGSAQIILFIRMIARPAIGSAALWSGLSAIFVLTHYHAGLVRLSKLWRTSS